MPSLALTLRADANEGLATELRGAGRDRVLDSFGFDVPITPSTPRHSAHLSTTLINVAARHETRLLMTSLF